MKLFALAVLLFFTATCNNTTPRNTIEVKGIIQPQGITSYQYGTHTITTEGDFFALRSEKINLDEFTGQEVKVYGKKIAGYPIDGGPDFLEVENVKNQE